jgi:nucleotide-binding universal stress UspA family protein
LISPPPFDEETARARLREGLHAWCAPLRDAGIEHESQLVDGVVADALMKTAGAVHADLVVVGRRGHGGFSELVLGSVPHALSHHCDVPVLIVPVEG